MLFTAETPENIVMSDSELHRWQKAFPLAGFKPALNAPTNEEKRIAQQFCPTIYADLELVKEEQADLTKNLGIDGKATGFFASLKERVASKDFAGIADTLFLFCLGDFPNNLTGAKLAVLGVELPESEILQEKAHALHGDESENTYDEDDRRDPRDEDQVLDQFVDIPVQILAVEISCHVLLHVLQL